MLGSPLLAVSIWLHLPRFLMMFRLMRAVSMKLFSSSQPSDSESGSPCLSIFSREVWRNRTPVSTDSYSKSHTCMLVMTKIKKYSYKSFIIINKSLALFIHRNVSIEIKTQESVKIPLNKLVAKWKISMGEKKQCLKAFIQIKNNFKPQNASKNKKTQKTCNSKSYYIHV